MSEERWRWIEGYEGLYMVSDRGQVKNRHGRVLKTKTTKRGYKMVTLSNHGAHSYPFVHRLVAKAFVPNLYEKPEVNHVDGDKTNNMADNLEWVTRSENELHAYRVLGKKPTAYWKGKPNPSKRRFTPDQVIAIRSDGRPSRAVAAEYGVSHTAIKNIRNCKCYKEVV